MMLLHAKGSCSNYYKVGNIGFKVYKHYSSLVKLEYLISLYAIRCGVINTTEVIGLNHNIITMKHIDGPTFEYCINEVIAKAPVEIITYDNRYDWAMRQRELQSLIKQHKKFIHELTDIGLTADDHCENESNFIVDSFGILHLIDFSLEAAVASPSLIHLVTP